MNDIKKIIAAISPQEKRELLEKILIEKSLLQSKKKSIKPREFELPEEYFSLKEKYGEMDINDIYFIPSENINSNYIKINGKQFTNYTSYNYLGMSGDPVVSQAAREAIEKYGTSVSASRIASGEKPLHRELENELATLIGTEDCLVFVGGYVTNETVIGHLCNTEDLILYDSLIHASIQSGCALSGATIKLFPHNNWQALDNILKEQRSHYRYVLIVIEGVYSMDGDIPDLPRFIEIKKKYKTLLMIDEAHSMGVLGESGAGIGEYYNVNRAEVDLWMGTLSKSFASCGGYIAAKKELIEYLKFTVPGFVYSVGISPANTAAALASIRLLKKESHRIKQLHNRAALFLELAKKQGFNTGNSRDSAVIPIILGQSLPCVKLYKILYDKGIFALPIMYPTVPENASRIRFFLSSTHTEEQIRNTINVIAENISDIFS